MEPETTVLVLGGGRRRNAGLPVRVLVRRRAGVLAGEYERRVASSPKGRGPPWSPGLNYQLACFHALAGHRDEASRAFGSLWAARPAGDRVGRRGRGLDSIRDRPDFPLSP